MYCEYTFILIMYTNLGFQGTPTVVYGHYEPEDPCTTHTAILPVRPENNYTFTVRTKYYIILYVHSFQFHFITVSRD